MILLSEIDQSSANAAAPWIWLAGSIAAYLGFLALNPLGSCIGAAYKLVRSRSLLWFVPALFGLAAVAFQFFTNTLLEEPLLDASLDELAQQALIEAWDLLPSFPRK